MLKLLRLLSLFNAALQILTGGKLCLIHKRNEQRRLREEISHLLERSVSGLGENGPEVEGVGKVADLIHQYVLQVKLRKGTYNEEDVPSPANAVLVIKSNRGSLTDHSVESEGHHSSQRHTLSTSLHIEDLSGNDPRQRTACSAEREVVDPRDDDEAPSSCTTTSVLGSRRETSQKDSCDDEGDAVENVTADQRPATSGSVNDEHTDELSDKGDDGGDHLVSKGLVTLDPDLGVDFNRVVLNSANTGHLRSDLHRDSKPQTSKARLIGEELTIALGRSLMLHRKTFLDLIKLSAHPGIVNISMRVKFSECLKTLIGTAVVNQPTRRLGEEEDQSGENYGWEVLDTKGDTPLA